MTQHCARCGREAPPEESDDRLYWEALAPDGKQVICPECITPHEQQAMDEQFMDLLDEQAPDEHGAATRHLKSVGQ